MSDSQTDPPVPAALSQDVYAELKRLADHHMRGERPGHTLEPNALVHEVYLKMHGRVGGALQDRTHFLAFASKAMRSVLVDHARARNAQKRGGGYVHVTVSSASAIVEDRSEDVLRVDDALTELARHDPKLVRIVEMKFYAGMTEAEIAQVLGVTDKTVRNHWSFARAWLRRYLEEHE